MIRISKKRTISNYGDPYIIAELGSNHNGDMQLAKRLIKAAKQAGADCVKFQSWSKETIFSKKTYDDNFFIADDYRNRTDYTLESIVEEYSISEEELSQMKKFCDEMDIEFTSTPFSEKEVDFLADTLKVPFLKVASMDLNNYPFLEYIAKKNIPIVLSTGLSNLYEIDKAVQTIENTGNYKIIILHCVSIYPPEDSQVNLRNIETLRTIYPDYPIGFSDHSLGSSIPLAAIGLGACILEKHFTLDKDLPGWDHKVSATPDELKIIVQESRRIVEALGTTRIYVTENEERRASFRRSIVARRLIKAGEKISRSDIDFKRPGTGIAPEDYDWVIGRVAKTDLIEDYPIQKNQLV